MRTRRPTGAAIPRAVNRLAAVALAAVTALGAPPAGAHSGGRAQLYVDSIRLEPQPGGWQAGVVVRDADSGRPEPGFGVQMTASGPAGQTPGPVDLMDADNDGRYEGVLPLSEGQWTLTVEAGEIAGGARAVPFRRAWPVALRAGQPVDVAGSRPPDGGPGHHIAPLALGITAAAALAGLVTLALSRSRRRARSAPATRPA